MQLKTPFSLALALALAVGSSAVFAQAMTPAEKPMTAQQARMATCNKEAAGKTGAERQTFMSGCLKSHGAAMNTSSTSPMTQQQKMTSCNANAKKQSLKGEERKNYMSSCLKDQTHGGASSMATAPTGAKSATKQTRKACRAEATEKKLKGADRKSFLASCEAGGGAH